MADGDTLAKLAGFARKAGLRPEVAAVLARRMGAVGGEPANTPEKHGRADAPELTPAKTADPPGERGSRREAPFGPGPSVRCDQRRRRWLRVRLGRRGR